MKLLNGRELAGYIKERQARQVRALRQAWHVVPKLAIIQTKDDPIINSYVALKKRYAEDILIELEYHLVGQAEAPEILKRLNNDKTVHGIIIQLPLSDPNKTDALVNAVAPEKDVDALGEASQFEPATAMSINWLLAAYNIDLRAKNIVIIGKGRLVGAPLEALWRKSGLEPIVLDATTSEAEFLKQVKAADVIVTGTGSAGVLASAMIKPNAVVIDAGVASEAGKLVGDLAPDVRERQDLTITPEKGGVGPLTVCALFDNVIRAARQVAGADQAA
ncbi:MAG TPA: bifunctional 5,10-methylenetetrahydrofolate dehydrogenase/5,10-methenyltetrahydrofolate cyclohydrolase [Candidatus Saccharimonadales bacterium]